MTPVPVAVPEEGVTLWQAIILGATFALNLIASVATATWTIWRGNQQLSERISDLRTEMHQAIDREMDAATRQFGDTVIAIRQKVTDTELWNRDNFVSKQTFNMIIAENRDSIRRLEDKIDTRFDKIEAKLEGYQRS